MPRPPRFTDDDVLDAALAASSSASGVTMEGIARKLGGPTGSIYHRFGSRDELLGRLWLRSIERFQSGLLDADIAGLAPPGAAARLVAMAVHVPTWCRSHPDEAVSLTMYRADRLAETGPESLRERARHVNDRLWSVLRSLCVELYGDADESSMLHLHLAVRILPYGLVRPWLGAEIPTEVDAAVAAGCRAVLQVPTL